MIIANPDATARPWISSPSHFGVNGMFRKKCRAICSHRSQELRTKGCRAIFESGGWKPACWRWCRRRAPDEDAVFVMETELQLKLVAERVSEEIWRALVPIVAVGFETSNFSICSGTAGCRTTFVRRAASFSPCVVGAITNPAARWARNRSISRNSRSGSSSLLPKSML